MRMWFFFHGQAYHLRVPLYLLQSKVPSERNFFCFGRLILLRSLLFFVGWHNYLINILKSIMVSLASVCYMYVSWRGNGRSVCSLLWDVTNVIAIFFFLLSIFWAFQAWYLFVTVFNLPFQEKGEDHMALCLVINVKEFFRIESLYSMFLCWSCRRFWLLYSFTSVMRKLCECLGIQKKPKKETLC